MHIGPLLETRAGNLQLSDCIWLRRQAAAPAFLDAEPGCGEEIDRRVFLEVIEVWLRLREGQLADIAAREAVGGA
jgi:hypothetical protein